MPTHTAPKLHNAMWPGLVGKGTDAGQEPPISLDRMLELTAAANVNGQKFDGIDYFLFLPHTNPEASDAELTQIADKIASLEKEGEGDKKLTAAKRTLLKQLVLARTLGKMK